MEGFAVVILGVLVVFFGAIGLCVWAMVACIRAVARAIFPRRRAPQMMAVPVQLCANTRCGCNNPPHARFCRRCGKSLPSLIRAVSSRVAML